MKFDGSFGGSEMRGWSAFGVSGELVGGAVLSASISHMPVVTQAPPFLLLRILFCVHFFHVFSQETRYLLNIKAKF